MIQQFASQRGNLIDEVITRDGEAGEADSVKNAFGPAAILVDWSASGPNGIRTFARGHERTAFSSFSGHPFVPNAHINDRNCQRRHDPQRRGRVLPRRPFSYIICSRS